MNPTLFGNIENELRYKGTMTLNLKYRELKAKYFKFLFKIFYLLVDLIILTVGD